MFYNGVHMLGAFRHNSTSAFASLTVYWGGEGECETITNGINCMSTSLA